MNTFEQRELEAVQAVIDLSRAHAAYYAESHDQDAAQVAILAFALELIKEQNVRLRETNEV